jgi:hypothetical protein
MGIFARIVQVATELIGGMASGEKPEAKRPPWPTTGDREQDARRAELIRRRMARVARHERASTPPWGVADKAANGE